VIDPRARWGEGEKPDYAGLPSWSGLPYTEEAAELEGADVAIVGAPFDDLVSDRPGARFGPRAIRAASWGPGGARNHAEAVARERRLGAPVSSLGGSVPTSATRLHCD
jgi:arginase family enzyme